MATEEQRITEKPEVTEEHHERAKKLMAAYDDQRPTIVLPGSGGTVAGTAVNEWVDDEGKPKYGDVEEGRD
jgi:muramoyltetrapeptide carboxypeptidase LdcA involved in peptidoglycan recycling